MASQGNTEFTKKLRAAVKAKIEEFGLDVDDELPDYVMIMVGNKKTKESMKSDLKLFLGENTPAFVEWLFGFFRKVKSATGSTGDLLGVGVGDTEVVSKSHSSDGKKRSESQSHAKSHSTSTAKKESAGRSQSKAGRHEVKSASKSIKDVRDSSKSRSSRHLPQRIESTRHHSRDGHYDDTVPRREHTYRHQSPSFRRPARSESRHHPQRSHPERDERRRSPTPRRGREGAAEEYMSDDEAGSDTDGVGGAVGSGFKKFSSPKELREPVPASPPPRRMKTKDRAEAFPAASAPANKPPADPTHSLNTAGHGQPANPVAPAVAPVAPKPRLKSQVQVVVPAGGRQVECIGLGGARWAHGYGDGRGLNHPNLFKRAMNDAATRRGVGGPLAQLASRRTLPVGRHQIELNYDIGDRRRSEDEGEEVVEVGLDSDNGDGQDSDKQPQQKIVVTMKRELLEKSGVLIVGSTDGGAAEPSYGVARMEQRAPMLKRIPTPPSVVGERRKRRADDLSRAFLRLSGMTPAKTGRAAKQGANESSPQHQPPGTADRAGHLTYEDDVEAGGNDSTPSNGRDSVSEACEAKETRGGELTASVAAQSQSATQSEDSRMVVLDYSDNKEVITPMTPMVWDGQIKLGQDDASSSDDDNEEEIDQVLATVAAIRQEHISIAADKIVPPTAMLSRPNLYYAQSVVAAAMGSCQDAAAAVHLATLGYNPDEYQTSLVPAVRSALQGQKIMERCRYWPECRNEDLCAYHHPTKVCPKFPNCWFGEKCLNIHPRCRFAPNCTKPNCRFSHYKLPVNIFPTASSSQQQSGSSASGVNAQSSAPTSSNPSQKPMMSQAHQPVLSNRPVVAHAALTASPMPHVSGRASMAHGGPATTIPCRFAGHCQNTACVYKHPPSCRFGANCTNPGCPFLHRGGKPRGGAGLYGAGGAQHSHQGRFKWTSPTLSTLQ